MIALTLMVLTVLYLCFFIVAGKKSKSWKARLIWWAVLLFPVVYYMWDYPIIKYQHELACKNEGGLKVFIQPEKMDRIRLDGNSFYEANAKGFLYRFSPRLQLVEAQDNFGTNGTGYYAYTLDMSSTGGPKKDWKFNKIKLESPSADLYVLSSNDEHVDNKRFKTIWKLNRNGMLYAQWTSLEYYWSTNGLFATQIGWRCFMPGESGPGASGKYPDKELTSLILK